MGANSFFIHCGYRNTIQTREQSLKCSMIRVASQMLYFVGVCILESTSTQTKQEISCVTNFCRQPTSVHVVLDGTPDWEWNSRLGMELQIGDGTPDWGWDSRLGMGLQIGDRKLGG